MLLFLFDIAMAVAFAVLVVASSSELSASAVKTLMASNYFIYSHHTEKNLSLVIQPLVKKSFGVY